MIFNQVVSGGGGSAPAHYIEKSVDANGKLTATSTLLNMTGVTDLGDYVLYGAYRGAPFPADTVIDLSLLTTVSGMNACENTFYGCTGIKSINLGSLVSISGAYAFQTMCFGCSNIETINLSSLTTISASAPFNQAFDAGTGGNKVTSLDLGSLTTVTSSGLYRICQRFNKLTDINISALTVVSGKDACKQMFNYCSELPHVVFSSVATLTGQNAFQSAFTSCSALSYVSFPSLTPTSFGSRTDQFNTMLSGCSNVTVHFPSNIQSTIGSWSDVTNGFGGTNTTVLFDLPATYTLTGADSVTYTRNPKYDTATALAWKVGAYGTTNFTPAYYTSGTTDPAVSDVIYSDAACTVAETTISAVA